MKSGALFTALCAPLLSCAPDTPLPTASPASEGACRKQPSDETCFVYGPQQEYRGLFFRAFETSIFAPENDGIGGKWSRPTWLDVDNRLLPQNVVEDLDVKGSVQLRIHFRGRAVVKSFSGGFGTGAQDQEIKVDQIISITDGKDAWAAYRRPLPKIVPPPPPPPPPAGYSQ